MIGLAIFLTLFAIVIWSVIRKEIPTDFDERICQKYDELHAEDPEYKAYKRAQQLKEYEKKEVPCDDVDIDYQNEEGK